MSGKRVWWSGATALMTGALLATASLAQADIKRTKSGVPDLSGNYDSGTLTPINRPAEFGDKQFMSREEADALIARADLQQVLGEASSDPDRSAPKKGGDGINAFGAGNVGGYNAWWVDRGEGMIELDGQFRTSIVYDPPNGRQPQMTMRGMQKMAANFKSFSYPRSPDRKPNKAESLGCIMVSD